VASCEEVTTLVVEQDAPQERLGPFFERISKVVRAVEKQ
jgi:hypothetical protein